MAAGDSMLLLEQDIKRSLRGGARRVGFALGQPLLDASNVVLTGARHGRVYRRGSGRLHTASAPDEAPALDTGGLRGSATLTANVFPHADDVTITAELSYPIFYSRYVEAIRARWFPLILERAQPEIDRVLSSGILAQGGFR